MGKQLIYRVWGSKAEVVAQAVLQGTFSLGVLPVPETGDLRVDLESWLTARAEAILAPGGRSVARALAAGEPRVWAVMWPHNAASAAVARRIGLTDLGRHVEPWFGTVRYPLGRLFCHWRTSAEHPMAVHARLVAGVELSDRDDEPPVGPDGARYPGPP